MRMCIGEEEREHREQIRKQILMDCVQGSVLLLGTHLVCAPPCAGSGCQGQERDAPMSIDVPATPHFPESRHMLAVCTYSPLLLAASPSISPLPALAVVTPPTGDPCGSVGNAQAALFFRTVLVPSRSLCVRPVWGGVFKPSHRTKHRE
jgi:hypothetical protein